MESASEELREYFVKVLQEEIDRDFMEENIKDECTGTGNYGKLHKWRRDRRNNLRKEIKQANMITNKRQDSHDTV